MTEAEESLLETPGLFLNHPALETVNGVAKTVYDIDCEMYEAALDNLDDYKFENPSWLNNSEWDFTNKAKRVFNIWLRTMMRYDWRSAKQVEDDTDVLHGLFESLMVDQSTLARRIGDQYNYYVERGNAAVDRGAFHGPASQLNCTTAKYSFLCAELFLRLCAVKFLKVELCDQWLWIGDPVSCFGIENTFPWITRRSALIWKFLLKQPRTDGWKYSAEALDVLRKALIERTYGCQN